MSDYRYKPVGTAYRAAMPTQHLENADSDADSKQQGLSEQQKETAARGMQRLHKGTPYVRKTAPALLEKGEAVIPKDKNPNNPEAKMFDAVKGKPAAKSAGKLKDMKLRRAKSGGFIAEHMTEKSDRPDGRGEEHILPDMAALHDHVEEHLGTPNEGEQVEAGEPAEGND